MKQVTTILCSIAFLLAGVFLATSEDKALDFEKHQTLSAATMPQITASMLPLDVQLDLGKKTQITDPEVITDTIHDTIFVPKPEVIVINKKRSEVNRPKSVTDVAWMIVKPGNTSIDTVNNQKIPVREEKTGECDVGAPETSTIQLIVDGKTVYSKNDNHSTGEP